MPIIITIVSNITVLVSCNIITWFGYFMSMNHGVNKDSSLEWSAPHHLPFTYEVFIRFVCRRNNSAILFCSHQIVCKSCVFKVKHIFSFNSLLVGFDFAVLLTCVSNSVFTVPPWSNYKWIISCLHGFQFSHSLKSCDITKQFIFWRLEAVAFFGFPGN